jgi:hypothetical protein
MKIAFAGLLALACTAQTVSAQFTGKLVYEVNSPATTKLTMIYYQNSSNAHIEAFSTPKTNAAGDLSNSQYQDTLLFNFGNRTLTHLQYKTGRAIITKYTFDMMSGSPLLQGGNTTLQTLGQETVNGYSCTHYVLTQQKSKKDIWITGSLSAPTIYVMGSYLYYTPGYPTFAKILAAGGNGVVVRIVYGFAGFMSTINLVSVDQTPPSSSLFKIPSYYTTIDNSNFTMPPK